MDGLIFIIIAIIFAALDERQISQDVDASEELEYEVEESRTTKVNEEYYDDPHAFSIIINALGFPKE